MMRKCLKLLALFCAANLIALAALAQTVTVKGKVISATAGESLSGTTITVKGTSESVLANDMGMFTLVTKHKLPLTLVITNTAYERKEVSITEANPTIEITVEPASGILEPVVVGPNRVATRSLSAGVTVESFSAANIKTAAAPSYYDNVGTFKGVDMVASSLTFKTPTTRGFSGSGNTRFNQIVSGMDNQAPGLNFSVGSVIGLNELDVASMELLQGASSALYGPGGMNGTLLINDKNPFNTAGLSFQVKTGIMHIDDRTRSKSPYYNWAVRWAQKVGEKFAFKMGFELIQAKDWVADDYRNYQRFGTKGSIVNGTRETDPNYDGVNVYGDETTANLKDVLTGIASGSAPFLKDFVAALPANIPVSRTGYLENDVVNPNTLNVKLSGGLYYKLTKNIEASVSGYFAFGNTVYTGSERYSLKDLKMGQYKFELKHKNWMLRAYTTQENSGESHNVTISTRLMNEAWKKTITYTNGIPTPQTTDWLIQYAQAYLAAKLAGTQDLAAHTGARSLADVGRPAPRSQAFQDLYDKVRKTPISQGGGLFLDRSDLYMVEGQYNLTDAVKFAEVLVGGNWKQYVLNSQGTLFPDKIGEPIKINEYGAYVQIAKSILDDRIKFSASGRYDKNENFDGKFTPRLSVVFKPAPDHNIRLSYQTAYRFPSTQQQWIDLSAGGGRLLGCNRALWDKYNFVNNPVYAAESVVAGAPIALSFVQAKPESVTSYELGYKSLINRKVLIDIYGYWGQYKNFISRRDVIQKKDPNGPLSDLGNTLKRDGYSIVINAPGKVTTYGWGGSVEYLLGSSYSVKANVSSDVLQGVPDNFQASFNTPKYRTNLSLSNSGFGYEKSFGFNVCWKWQDAFDYQSDFVYGRVEAFHSVDAQISYNHKPIKTLFKLGASNLLNQYYRSGLGNATIGGLYYFSVGYNL